MTQKIDFPAESMVESIAVPVTMFLMISPHSTLRPMVKTKQMSSSAYPTDVKSTPPTITSLNGPMRLGILVIMYAKIQAVQI